MERCKIVCLIVVMEFIDCLLVNRMLMNFIVSVLFIFEYFCDWEMKWCKGLKFCIFRFVSEDFVLIKILIVFFFFKE